MIGWIKSWGLKQLIIVILVVMFIVMGLQGFLYVDAKNEAKLNKQRADNQIARLDFEGRLRVWQNCEIGNNFRNELIKSQLQETEDIIATAKEDNDTDEDNATFDKYRKRRVASLRPLRPRDCGPEPVFVK